MTKLKQGDKIVILDLVWNLNDPITIGKTYDLERVLDYASTGPFMPRFVIIDDNGNMLKLYSSQFLEVNDYRQHTIAQIVNHEN